MSTHHTTLSNILTAPSGDTFAVGKRAFTLSVYEDEMISLDTPREVGYAVDPKLLERMVDAHLSSDPQWAEHREISERHRLDMIDALVKCDQLYDIIHVRKASADSFGAALMSRADMYQALMNADYTIW